MAERLPVGAARNTKSPSLSSFGSSPASNEVSNASIDRMNGQAVFQDQDSNGSSNQLLSNGSTTNSNRNSGHNKQAHLDATTRNGGRTKESESLLDNERVEQDEPGVYITLTSLPGGVKDLNVGVSCNILVGWRNYRKRDGKKSFPDHECMIIGTGFV